MGIGPLRLLLPAAALIALALAAPAAAHPQQHGVNRAHLAVKAERAVETRHTIDVTSVSRCTPKKKHGVPVYSVWVCYWRAVGVWPGDVPYQCAGKARYKRKPNRWRIEACENIYRYQAPLGELGPHPLFGFNDLWTMKEQPAFDLLGRSQSSIVRVNLDWSIFEEKRGTYNFAFFDKTYDRLAALGIRPLWVFLAAPCWAQPDPGRCASGAGQLRPAPANYDEMAQAAAAVAKHYPDSIGIEIWNEPNYPRFWGGEWPEPDRYAEMLKLAADAIHSQAPGMPVVSAGMSPHSDSDEHAIGYRNFLERLYELGALQKADAIGVHPYPGVGPDDGYIEQLRLQFGAIQILQQRFNDTGTPLWITEFGVSTTGKHQFTPEQQGVALAELYNTVRRIGNVPVVIVHSLFEDLSLAEREAGFGVVEQDLDPKPAFCALVRVRELSC